MPASRPRRRIVIEFEPGIDPVVGTISAPPAVTTEFCGWLELISTLDRQFGAGGDIAPAPADSAARTAGRPTDGRREPG